MRKLTVFNQVSVDGYFRTTAGDIGWVHEQREDPEFKDFIAGNASGGGVLVFGRKTYEMMASFWPTPAAAQQFPVVAKQMNAVTRAAHAPGDRVTVAFRPSDAVVFPDEPEGGFT